MSEYILHCFAQSGNAYKAAIMLELCGANWTPQWVDFFKGKTRTDEWRETYNELGEVPVLEHGELKLTQSSVIQDYLVEQFGKFGWSDDAERREVLRWTVFDNQKVSGMLGTLRLMRTLLKTGETEVTEFLHGRATGALAILDKRFAANDFAIGAKPTTADLSLCGYMFFEGELGIDLAEYPNVSAWLDRIKALPGWKHPYDLMPGHPLPGA